MAHVLFHLHPHQKILTTNHGTLGRLWPYFMVHLVRFDHTVWYSGSL